MNALDNYQAKIAYFNQQYGSRVWALLCQADVRMRLEEMPAMLIELTEEADAVKKAGGKHEFDPESPWKTVWKRAVSREAAEFWEDEFKTPAMNVRLHLKSLGEEVDGDAPIEHNGTQASTTTS